MQLTNQTVMISIYLLIGLFILYKFLTHKKTNQRYRKEMEDILNADQYKVKNRFDQ